MRPYYIFIAALTCVFFSIVYVAIMSIGNPLLATGLKWDERRLTDLIDISYEIDNAYRTNGTLPSTEDLQKLTYIKNKLTDPQTQKPYEYIQTGVSTYVLCADFNHSKDEYTKIKGYVSYGLSSTKTHLKGRSCFNYQATSAHSDTIVPIPVMERVKPEKGTYSSMSAQLQATKAQFDFSYSGKSKSYVVDIALDEAFSKRIYYNFASGQQSPVIMNNPGVYTEYMCGETIYWRVVDSLKNESPVQNAVVTCVY